jgi:beta-lactamase regulating signal transducer with metallopeptidase domain
LELASDFTITSSNHLQEELILSSESLHWPFWVICGWITGIVLCLLYALTGRIGVHYIFKSASPYRRAYLKADISHIARDLGIPKEVKVVVSCRCRLPFTYKFIHPVLVIPNEAKDWPESKLHAVLIHELAHIRRYDYLVLFLSRFICSVFWFIPVTWIAHSYLQLEQENICDLVAIQKGERPTAYARYMIDFVHTTRSLVLWSAIFIKKGRNKMLEKRVTNVLNMKRSPLQGRDSKMKTRTLLSILILVFAVLIVAEGFATEPKVSKKDYRFVSGTWINEEYNSYAFPARWEMHRDGSFDGYNRISDTGKKYTGHYAIVDKWTDSEGNGPIDELHISAYELDKFSESGKVWEYMGDKFAFPTEIDESHPKYHIYYRQE